MRFPTAAYLASLAVMAPGLACAQVASGNEVSVNPVPAGGAVLLYPGGQYMRVVHPLLQPGESLKDLGPVQLHMPTHRARLPADETAAATPAPRHVARASEPKPAAPAPVAPRRVATAAPAPAAAPPPPPPPQQPGFNMFGAAGLDLGAPPAAAPPAPPPKQVARAEPPPQRTGPSPADEIGPGLTKRSVILFAAGASDPAQSALGAIKFLAGDLNSSMVSAASRVQILAYGGERGDKGSDARRLSLKRALAIRQVLIDDGVPSERIDVRAMGGADDGGPADRVDVYVKA